MSHGIQSLGAALKYHRKQRRWSPETVAHEAKMAARTYRRIENDERPADASEVERICEAFGIGIEGLLSATASPFEMRLRLEYGADLFSIEEEEGSSVGPLLILRADGIDDARAQIEADQAFWASCDWVGADGTLRPVPSTGEQVGLWVRDAAAALAPGGSEHTPDDDMPERLQRVRHHVVPLGIGG